jgi:hypothetical protein
MWAKKSRKGFGLRIYPEIEDQELHIEGDLLVFVDKGKATLYQTVETYMRPSQGIIDELVLEDRDYYFDSDTGIFRELAKVGERKVTAREDVVQELLKLMPSL